MEFADVQRILRCMALLIFALFVWKIYGLIDNDASYLQWIGYGMGAASALYFVLRSGGVVAKIALILVAITYLYGCVYIWVKKRGGFSIGGSKY